MSESTAGGSDVLDDHACGSLYDHIVQTIRERVYGLTPNVTGDVTFELLNMTSDRDTSVLVGTCDQAQCIGSSTQALTATGTVPFTASAGVTCCIVVEAFGGVGGFDPNVVEDTGGCPEDCDDGVDTDLDGDIDCADADCANDPVCPEICDHLADDNGNRLVDGADPACFAQPYCCDDDGDGFVDAAWGGTDCHDTVVDPADTDGDHVPAFCDNCAAAANPTLGDGDGEACDHCVAVADPAQTDADGDGRGDTGDVCADMVDPGQVDADAGGLDYPCDVCQVGADPGQEDLDADGVGDACDLCVDVPDPAQDDLDVDGDGASSCGGTARTPTLLAASPGRRSQTAWIRTATGRWTRRPSGTTTTALAGPSAEATATARTPGPRPTSASRSRATVSTRTATA